MPKPRKTAGSFFAVSAWQDKQAGGDGGKVADEGGPEYSVVTMPLLAVPPSTGGGGTSAAPPHGPDSMLTDVQPATAIVGPAAAPTAAPAAVAAAGGWQAKRRKTADEAAAAAADGSLGSRGPGASGLMSSYAQMGSGDADQARAQQQQQLQLPPPPQQQQEPGAVELEGTAYLALLPSGNITGHLLCRPSMFAPRRRSLGLMAEVVVAGRECTRDADWGVLRFTLVNLGGSSGSNGGAGNGGAEGAAPGGAAPSGGGACELTFLAEKTGGDAMQLRAPVPWQGIELEELPELDAACSCTSAAGLTLAFRCQQLLSGPAGEALLARLQPSLVGRGAVCNTGEMQLSLPPDAAQQLGLAPVLPPRRPPAGARGHSPGEAAAGTPQRQETQQAGAWQVTGRGGGGGRAVQDSEDW